MNREELELKIGTEVGKTATDGSYSGVAAQAILKIATEYAISQLQELKESIFEGKKGTHFANSKDIDAAIKSLKEGI